MVIGKTWLRIGAFVVAATIMCGPESARGQLRWQSPKKEVMHLRIVALAWSHPRSSFFENEEVFIAEKELSKDESRLVKLVYGFLPYQPRLSDAGLEYDTMHELHATRDADCDETLGQMMVGHIGDWREPRSELRYSKDAPPLNFSRHKSVLPCYLTSADDYNRPLSQPTDEIQP